MKLTSPKDVRALLAELDFKPSKILGQNFLIDGNVLGKMVDSARIEPSDTVLEIGPGLGTLTEQLCERAGQVVAIEKDKRLFQWLEKHLAHFSNLRMLHADALDVDLDKLVAGGVTKVVSNLPYSVGSRILVELFSVSLPPAYIQVTVQKEVGDRIRAKHSTHDYGLLSIWAQALYDVAPGHVISGKCFFPEPQIQSAIVEMTRRDEPMITRAAWPTLMRITKQAFSQRRKKLGTSLPQAPFEEVGIDPNDRPENIPPPGWCGLASAVIRNL